MLHKTDLILQNVEAASIYLKVSVFKMPHSTQKIYDQLDNYCPVIWMFHSRSLNIKINRLHKRCLCITYNDKRSTLDELWSKDNVVSVPHNSIHALAIEMYKVANDMSPEIMNKVYKLREEIHYHLRYTKQFLVDSIHSVFNGSESDSYLDPKIWEQMPTEIKNIDLSSGLKKTFKKWKQ